MCNYIVTKEEVEKAEQDIFEIGQHFNDEQKTFLKCLDSCSVQAYAGTGKTSAIVGKLHTLAQKIVWQNGRGVCVISHTNVAVDEIIKHVAKHYPAIMQYPNFIGTIQEFVNKFLFIPYLASKGLQIKFLDESRYFDYKNDLQDQTIIQRIDNKLTQLNHSNNSNAKKDFFERLNTVHLVDGKLYARAKNSGFDEFTDLKTAQVSQDKIVEALSGLIQKKHNDGSFLFVESFIYGNEYLKQNQLLKDIIAQRFQFVFLDEAQDCSKIQLNILNELFGGGSKTVFQQIGDINQAISETIWKADDSCLHLRQSMRFGQSIPDFLNKFRVDDGSGVTGCCDTTKKFLIIYKSGKENNVLSIFAEILKTEEKSLEMNKCYFAISHKHDQLQKYFSDYSEMIAKNRNKKLSYRFETDIEYLGLITEDTIKKIGSHFVSSILFSLLYKHYKEGGNSWSELKELLRNGDKSGDFKNLVIEISNDVLSNEHIRDLDKLKNDLNKILGKDVIDFTHSGDAYPPASIAPIIPDNTHTSPDGIKIKIGTIHSVKGQTHDATLLFSNQEYSKQDIQHALDSTPQQTPKYKKLLYVAASRPKYLFAFAIEENAYNELKDKSCFNDFEK